MSSQFQYLFSPVRIGNLEIKNRVVSTAHVTFFAENNMPSERHVHYHSERAKGGVGLIVHEAVTVHPSSFPYEGIIFGYDERVIPGFKRTTDAVHQHDAKIFCEVFHKGRQVNSILSRRSTLAPSATRCIRNRETPKVMEKEEIEEIIQGFATTARNVREGGFDGVELHCTHGYLLQQWLSPISNKRTDEYGGSLANRVRFVVETIDAVRAAVGNDFVVGIRLVGDEFTPGGLTLRDMQEIAPLLTASGKLDYISVSHSTYFSLEMVIPPSYVPLGAFVSLSAGIKESVEDLPIIGVGRINDPVQAEKVLADGHADLVGMTRANICDPQLANKARDGRLNDIRTCIACNTCIGRVFSHKPVTCLQNPAVGFEVTCGVDATKPAAVRKKVMVVGGGPAGLKAAETAAIRGHDVTVYEKDGALGGQVALSEKAASRQEFAGSVRNLKKSLDALGVKIVLDTPVTPEIVKRESPDAVIVATGSAPDRSGASPLFPQMDGLPGADQSNVLTYRDVLKDGANVGQHVVIIDDESHHRAPAIAELLADHGKNVRIVTALPRLGMELAPNLEQPFVYRLLQRKGVHIMTNTAVKAIEDSTLITLDLNNNTSDKIEGVDNVVLVMGSVAETALYRALKGLIKELYLVGDASSPRYAVDAMFDAFHAGLAV